MPWIGQTRTFGGVEHVYVEPGKWVPQPQVGLDVDGGGGPEPGAPATWPTEPGQITAPDPNHYWSKPGPFAGAPPEKAEPNEPGSWFEGEAYDEAVARYQQLSGTEPGGAGGPRGPTAEQLAIERSKIATANMANYIDSVTRGLSVEIDAKRLSTEQAMHEFNRQLDAMTEARTGFLGAQQYTIPKGVEYVPGFEPEGLATQLGLQPWEASPIEYDPFGMALEIIQGTPEITGIGSPDTDAVQQAIELAKQFL